MLRRVNGIALTAREKGEVVRLIADIDGIVGERSPRFDLDAETIRQISEICSMSREALAELDAASTERWRARWPEPTLLLADPAS